jgi:hypothetical protein
MRKLTLTTWLTMAALVTLTACGGGNNPDRASDQAGGDQQTDGVSSKIGDTQASVLDGELSFDNGTASGTGSIRIRGQLPDDANNYTFEFQLEPGGKLTLVTNSKMNLTQGVEVEFTRPDESARLTVVLRAPGRQSDQSQRFAGIRADQPLRFSIDVHNDEGEFAHILIWDQSSGSDELTFDSGAVRRGSPGRGFGLSWGFRLQQASVSEAVLGKPRDEG